jgi:hypothetical protein
MAKKYKISKPNNLKDMKNIKIKYNFLQTPYKDNTHTKHSKLSFHLCVLNAKILNKILSI